MVSTVALAQTESAANWVGAIGQSVGTIAAVVVALRRSMGAAAGHGGAARPGSGAGQARNYHGAVQSVEITITFIDTSGLRWRRTGNGEPVRVVQPAPGME